MTFSVKRVFSLHYTTMNGDFTANQLKEICHNVRLELQFRGIYHNKTSKLQKIQGLMY